MSNPYSTDDEGRIVQELFRVEDISVLGVAQNVHKERTGCHGNVSVWLGDKWLNGTVTNVERDEDRLRFINSTLRKLDGNRSLREALEAGQIKHKWDEFCVGLWAYAVGLTIPTWVEGAGERRGLDYLARPYILKKGGTIFFGAPKSGKSYLEYLQMVSIDAGISLFWPVEQMRVLVVNLERDEESVRQRIGNINVALGLDRERPLLMLNKRGSRLVDLEDSLRYYVREMGIGHVGLDSLSRAGAGSMVEDQAANRTMDVLNRVCPSWSAIGHVARQGDDHVFGSQMYDAAADMLVRVTSQQDGPDKPLGVGLQVTGANESGRSGMEIIRLEFDALGLTGVRRAKQGEFAQIEQGQTARLSLSAQIANLLGRGAMSVKEISELTQASEAACKTELNRHKTKFTLVGKDGKANMWGLMAAETVE